MQDGPRAHACALFSMIDLGDGNSIGLTSSAASTESKSETSRCVLYAWCEHSNVRGGCAPFWRDSERFGGGSGELRFWLSAQRMALFAHKGIKEASGAAKTMVYMGIREARQSG
jgi:hypothetical protein